MEASEVSVVVQGVIGPWTAQVLSSVRDHLPQAQLVLSTWAGSQIAGLPAPDALVCSADPGSVPYRTRVGAPAARQFNTNRMLRSTAAGLAAADRPYLLKLRSDTPLVSSDMLQWFGRFTDRHPRLRVFDERVVTISVATRPGRRMPGYLFHPSDCVHFGTAADVRRLWEVPEIDEAANADYWLRRDPRGDNPMSWNFARLFNEQILWLGCLRRAGQQRRYPHAGWVSEEAVTDSDLSLVNNFTVIEPWQFGVTLPKLAALTAASEPATYLWFADYLALYERYCAPYGTARAAA